MPSREDQPPRRDDDRLSTWLQDLVRDKYSELTPAERSVADFLVRQPERIVFMSAAQLAAETRTSDATVIRTARSLGFAGLPELKHGIGGSLLQVVTPAERVAHRLRTVASEGTGALDVVFDEVRERLDEQQRRLDPAQFDAAVTAIAAAREVWVFGVGVSTVAAQYLAAKLNRAGRRAFAARSMGFAFADEVLRLEAGSVAVIFSPSRVFREVEVVLSTVKDLGATSILIADSLGAQGDESADIVLSSPLSMSGITGEVISELVVCDALVFGAARRGSDAATTASERLTAVRQQLSPSSTRHARPRKRNEDPTA